MRFVKNVFITPRREYECVDGKVQEVWRLKVKYNDNEKKEYIYSGKPKIADYKKRVVFALNREGLYVSGSVKVMSPDLTHSAASYNAAVAKKHTTNGFTD